MIIRGTSPTRRCSIASEIRNTPVAKNPECLAFRVCHLNTSQTFSHPLSQSLTQTSSKPWSHPLSKTSSQSSSQSLSQSLSKTSSQTLSQSASNQILLDKVFDKVFRQRKGKPSLVSKATKDPMAARGQEMLGVSQWERSESTLFFRYSFQDEIDSSTAGANRTALFRWPPAWMAPIHTEI
jgi:hypothetical protein